MSTEYFNEIYKKCAQEARSVHIPSRSNSKAVMDIISDLITEIELLRDEIHKKSPHKFKK